MTPEEYRQYLRDEYLKQLRKALDAHLDDPVDARDRPESWQKLWAFEQAADYALTKEGWPRGDGVKTWWDRE
mgnify:CR=1 FL=1